MQLTSPALQITTIAAAVAATLAALLLWNRVRGPRPVRVLCRIILMAGGYAATAAAVLVSVNIAYGGLIVSVDDLFGNLDPPAGHHLGRPHRHPAELNRSAPTPVPAVNRRDPQDPPQDP